MCTNKRRSNSASCCKDNLFVLCEICRAAFLVEVVALAVDDDDERHLLHVQPAQRLGAEILIRDELRALDALGEQRACAPDRAEIDAAVLLHRLDNLRQVHRHPCGRSW